MMILSVTGVIITPGTHNHTSFTGKRDVTGTRTKDLDRTKSEIHMILVDARCVIVPERHSDFISEVQKIIPTVRKECGCIRYELVADVHVFGVFHFIEEWESQKHLDEHIARPHMQAYFAQTASWHSAPIELKIYDVHSSRSITIDD